VTHEKVVYKDKIVYVPKSEYVPYPQIKVVEKPIYIAVPMAADPAPHVGSNDNNNRNQTKPSAADDNTAKNDKVSDVVGNPALAQLVDWLLPVVAAMATLIGFKNRISRRSRRANR